MGQRHRLLILVVAYHAETTVISVLERIPKKIFTENECEVLVVDDGSEDNTFSVADDFRRKHIGLPIRVFRNQINLGYGGNQKIGYAYALKHYFDYVALIHGDGQYAPEELPRLLEPLKKGESDVVFGSRFLKRWDAIKGGMPLYKYIGNRILSGFQNMLLGTKMSELHSGYRIYCTSVLRNIRFKLNTNDFHFDTEIIIQLLNAGARIVELPIPTYYGKEICRVQGLRYAWHVVVATLQNVFHRWGVLYQRRYDPIDDEHSRYTSKLGYPSSHQWALDRTVPGAKVIDFGGGPAVLAQKILEKGCDVTIVGMRHIVNLPQGAREIVCDLDDPLGFTIKPYDCILLLDIIEHLKNPEAFLEGLHSQFEYDSKTVILSTPNIGFFVQRLMLLLGQFNYGKYGVLDRTHTRLFTFRKLRHLLRDEGFQIRELHGVPAPFPRALGDGGLARFLLSMNILAIRLSRTLFSYQIFAVAETTPPLDFLLSEAEKSRTDRDHCTACQKLSDWMMP
jgi:glycosyltransferase involved in cell wall biosynthesis